MCTRVCICVCVCVCVNVCMWECVYVCMCGESTLTCVYVGERVGVGIQMSVCGRESHTSERVHAACV